MSSQPDVAAPSPETLQHARDSSLRLGRLLRAEREAAAEFLMALAEFDRARHWRELGHASLFLFLHRELGLSAGTAHHRRVAAELIQRFPEILEPLRDGRLCLSAIVELSRVITPENRGEVLPRFFHLSRREAQAVAASIAPAARPPERDLVTAVRLAKSATAVVYLAAPSSSPRVLSSRAEAGAAGDDAAGASSSSAHEVPPGDPDDPAAADAAGRTPSAAPSLQTPPSCAPAHDAAGAQPQTAPPSISRPDAAEPLDAELSRLHVTVTREFLRKLDAARDALSHAKPGASMAEILEAGLDLVLARQAQRRAHTDRPRPSRPSKDARHVPAAVRRAVWQRSGGRCEWPLDSGGCCGSTTRVELDHIIPRARGGRSTLTNLRVLCCVHNAVAARRAFGDAWMDRFTRRGAGPPPGSPAPAPEVAGPGS
ncbi:MAG TPA: HNH endonuclease [Anaeromyxobacteraceae bacterium]|nr:HNH endonuclease [Anaeromyxobacteraceae bacterium]